MDARVIEDQGGEDLGTAGVQTGSEGYAGNVEEAGALFMRIF